jgi:hypothetical protein
MFRDKYLYTKTLVKEIESTNKWEKISYVHRLK